MIESHAAPQDDIKTNQSPCSPVQRAGGNMNLPGGKHYDLQCLRHSVSQWQEDGWVSHTHTHTHTHTGVCLTCSIWQRSEVQSMFSQGWYMPSVTQLSRITMMLILSNHVRTGLGLRSIAAEKHYTVIHLLYSKGGGGGGVNDTWPHLMYHGPLRAGTDVMMEISVKHNMYGFKYTLIFVKKNKDRHTDTHTPTYSQFPLIQGL